MGPAVFILAILGCGEGDTACQQVAVAPTHYTSEAACQYATEKTLLRHSNADYPVVVAQCRKAGIKASAETWSDDVALPQPEATPLFGDQPAGAYKGQRLARR